jgi:hypothetical protein
MAYSQIHRFGTQAQYDALKEAGTLNSNYLYFTSDTGKFYKGSIDYTDSLISVSVVPATGVAGKIYFESTTGMVKAYIGDAWTVISYPLTQEISAQNASTVKVASEKAIVDYVDGIVGGDDIVASIQQKTNAGTAVSGVIEVTKGSGSTYDVALQGVAVNPTWDSSTRQLVIPVVQPNGTTTNVTADIGKDIFLDPSEGANYFDPSTKEIVLTLNDADPTAEPPKAATVIRIPASALYNDYTGGSTNSGTVSIDGTNHAITFDVNINAATNNAISFDSNGLMVDLSAYATTAALDNITDGLQDQIDATTATLSATTAALGVLENNYNATTAALDTLTTNYNNTTAALDTLTTNYNATTAALDTLTTNYNATTVAVAQNTADIASLAQASTEWAGFAD